MQNWVRGISTNRLTTLQEVHQKAKHYIKFSPERVVLPWEMMVDSRATTAFPFDKASETSGETLINPTPC